MYENKMYLLGHLIFWQYTHLFIMYIKVILFIFMFSIPHNGHWQP